MARIFPSWALATEKNVESVLRSDGGLLILLFLLEAIVFGVAVNRNIAEVYPRFNDQIQYLSESYLGYEHYRQNGVLAGLWYALSQPAAQGALHDFFALIIFIFAGASRVTALFVNFFVFMFWQAITFSAIKQSKFSSNVAWFGVALLLCLRYPWLVENPGSAFDFRLDHMAMSLMGISIMMAAKSDGFLSRKSSILFGIVVGITILTRFLTAAYFTIALILLICAYAGKVNYPARLKNMLLAACTACFFVIPFFVHNFDYIYNYYVVGHLTGVESAIRDSGKNVAGRFWFVLKGAFLFQGYLFYAVIISIPLINYFPRKKEKGKSDRQNTGIADNDLTRNWRTIGIIFFLSPLIALSLHRQISSAVLGILAPGVILIVMSFLAPILAAREQKKASAQRTRGIAIVVIATLALGFGNYALRLLYPPYPKEFMPESKQLNLVVDFIYGRIINSGLKEPKIASDQVTDFLDAQIFRVMIYERKNAWLPLVMTLPTGIFEEDPQLLLNRLYQSDFVFLTDSTTIVGAFPYDKQMRILYPVLQRYCESHMKLVGKYHFYGRDVSLYSKPSLVIDKTNELYLPTRWPRIRAGEDLIAVEG